MKEPPPAPPAEPDDLFDPPFSRAARCWASLAFTLALVGGGLAGLYFLLRPGHRVSTLVLVPTSPTAGAPLPSDRDLAAHQRNQMAMARSRVVLESALRSARVATLPSVVNKIDPVEWLEKQVKVDFDLAPEILRISMSGTETAELVVLVNEIRDAYIREIIGTREAQRVARSNMLEGLIRNYDARLKAAREAQKDDAERLGGGNTDVRARQLAHLNTSLAQTERELLGAKSQLTKARLHVRDLEEELKNHDKDQVPEYALTEALNHNKTVQTLRARISMTQAKITDFLKTSNKGEKDPAVIKLRDDVKQLQDQITKFAEAERPRLVKEVKEMRRQQLQLELTNEKARINSVTAAVAQYDDDFKRLSELVQKQGKLGAKVDMFQSEITHLDTLLKQLKHEQDAIKVELQAPPRHKVIEEATVARADPLARRVLMTAGAGVVGFFFALFGVAWLEYRTRRVDSVDEVVLGLGMRLVGTVPASKSKGRKTASKAKDPAQQVLTESVDAARTMLLHLARTHSLRTVMVTSAVAGEGKTSLSCHLAASLARAGLRMLLIDGDMRNPTAHRLFGLPCDQGFCEVLTDKVEADKVIKQTSLRGLYLMPAGNWSDQVALALSQNKPAQLFEQLRQQFDLIIVDSSPILPVADGLMIGQQVDGVLLSVLCQVSRLTNLYAAWQRIEQLGVRPLGVVINGVRANLYGSTYAYPYPRKKRTAPKPAEKGAR
jgi:capsular exopolysaccharide synthesis family protein